MNARLRDHGHAGSLGQVSTEYVVLVSLVALPGLLVTTALGRKIASLFGRSTGSLGCGVAAAVTAVDPGGVYDGENVPLGADIADDLVGPTNGPVSLVYRDPAGGSGGDAVGGADIEPIAIVTPASGGVNARLSTFYSDPKNYAKVYDQVIHHGYGSIHNGCVAFMSTALRMSGVAMPKDGDPATRVTQPLSNYLENKLGWERISKGSDLRPGDVVFTQDGTRFPGYPAHTYMFSSWADQAKGVAWVVDNQGAAHKRNINQGGGGFNFTPFQYALRAPR